MGSWQNSPGQALLAAGMRPVPPGEFIARHVLAPRGLTPADASAAMGLDPAALDRVLQGAPVGRAMTECLASFTGFSVNFWLNMQAADDLASQVRAAWGKGQAATSADGPRALGG